MAVKIMYHNTDGVIEEAMPSAAAAIEYLSSHEHLPGCPVIVENGAEVFTFSEIVAAWNAYGTPDYARVIRR